jgi:hypothetical protein
VSAQGLGCELNADNITGDQIQGDAGFNPFTITPKATKLFSEIWEPSLIPMARLN